MSNLSGNVDLQSVETSNREVPGELDGKAKSAGIAAAVAQQEFKTGGRTFEARDAVHR